MFGSVLRVISDETKLYYIFQVLCYERKKK